MRTVTYNVVMSPLSKIEAEIDALPTTEKQQLLLFIAVRLREQGGPLPPPRRFSSEQLQAWIAQDEADLQHLRKIQAE